MLRLGVGMQGLGVGRIKWFGAKDRLQMRSLTGTKEPEKPADPIIVHPDVRKMLLTGKAFTEGALAYWGAMALDRSQHHPVQKNRAR